jgi:hypothetical protein
MSEVVWERCIFCDRRWDEKNLELELCPDCIRAVRRNPNQYTKVKIDMLLKFGDFQDPAMEKVVKMIWEEISL